MRRSAGIRILISVDGDGLSHSMNPIGILLGMLHWCDEYCPLQAFGRCKPGSSWSKYFLFFRQCWVGTVFYFCSGLAGFGGIKYPRKLGIPRKLHGMRIRLRLISYICYVSYVPIETGNSVMFFRTQKMVYQMASRSSMIQHHFSGKTNRRILRLYQTWCPLVNLHSYWKWTIYRWFTYSNSDFPVRYVSSPPARWGLLDFIRAVVLLLLRLLRLLLLQFLLDHVCINFHVHFRLANSSPISSPTSARSGHRWTSTAGVRSEWARLDLNRKGLSAVGTAGPEPGTSGAQWAPLDLNLGPSELSVHRWTSTAR